LRVLTQDVFDLMPDLADRIKRGARVLKDHRISRPYILCTTFVKKRGRLHTSPGIRIDPRLRCTRSAL
jgi:hypothetical protein